jgi:hypothetical protein
MRKIVLFVAALLFMAVPVMAASEVTITCTSPPTVVGDVNWVTVEYSSDHNLIRAFGIDITLDSNDGNIIDVCDVDPNYRIFPGQISIVEGDVNDYYQCYDPCDLGDANLAVEMGSLYTFDTNYISDVNLGYGKQPGTSGVLLRFAYQDATGYKLDVNERRGGIVMEDPYENPDFDRPLCEYTGAIGCTVPDVIGMDQATAEAAITDAGLTVGTVGKTASCGAVADFTVATQNPTGGGTVDCGTAVDFDICECYYGQADYAQWVEVNKPICWCYPRQCHGDADGKKTGNVATGYAYVEQPDLDLLGLGWKVKDPTKGPGILNLQIGGVPVACADFAHNKTGNVATGYARIEQPDLDRLGLYWKVKEPTKGPGTPADCLPGNRNP